MPEIAYEVVSSVSFTISISINKKITSNMLKQKEHSLESDSSVG